MGLHDPALAHGATPDLLDSNVAPLRRRSAAADAEAGCTASRGHLCPPLRKGAVLIDRLLRLAHLLFRGAVPLDALRGDLLRHPSLPPLAALCHELCGHLFAPPGVRVPLLPSGEPQFQARRSRRSVGQVHQEGVVVRCSLQTWWIQRRHLRWDEVAGQQHELQHLLGLFRPGPAAARSSVWTLLPLRLRGHLAAQASKLLPALPARGWSDGLGCWLSATAHFADTVRALP
mmetsp:Transcript_89809/g.192574  ORF Transcript_89809/g.192574 Transcript_89809/m.192574 type:complete len:231 (+) Transcript_89809:302-994(+)